MAINETLWAFTGIPWIYTLGYEYGSRKSEPETKSDKEIRRLLEETGHFESKNQNLKRFITYANPVKLAKKHDYKSEWKIREFDRLPDLDEKQVPEHAHFEGIETDGSDYKESINSLRHEKQKEHTGRSQGVYRPGTDTFFVKSRPIDILGEVEKTHEHEVIHRLLEDEPGEGGWQKEFEELDFEPEEEWERIQSIEIADKYGIPIEETLGVKLERPDYSRLMEEMVESPSENDEDEIKLEETVIEYLTSGRLENLMPFKPAFCTAYQVEPEDALKADDALKRIEQEVGFDKRRLIEEVSDYESIQELYEDTRDLEKPNISNLNRYNGSTKTPKTWFMEKIFK